jgi:hypothetical protein
VEEPGHDAVSPFKDASDGEGSADVGEVEPAPIVLGDTTGLSIGVEQQTLAQQAQANVPLEVAPAAGLMLTGSVAAGDGAPRLDTGSFWGGLARTCIFGSVIMLVTGGMFMWAESGYDDFHDEQVQVSWTDESRTDGNFTLPYAPVRYCNLHMYDNHVQQHYQHGMWEWIKVDCDGTLVVAHRVDAGYFSGGWESSDNATVTIIFPQAPPNGSQVNATIELMRPSNPLTQHPESIISDGVSTEFTFPVVPSEFQSCSFSVHAWTSNQDIVVDVMSERFGNCLSQNLTTILFENVGFVEFESGYGEFHLSSSAPEDLDLWADYEEEYEGRFLRTIAPVIGSLIGVGLGIVWLMQVVNAYKEGKSNKGHGLLAGVVSAFVIMVGTMIAFFIIFEVF